jgi:DnaK suppressor protein
LRGYNPRARTDAVFAQAVAQNRYNATARSPEVSKTSAKTASTGPASDKASAPAPATKPAKTAAVSKAAPPPQPTAAPEPERNRFAERFSPPKPPARGYPEPMETVKPAHKADPKLVNAWKSKAGRDLTEAELLAMPESEYMNDKQIDFFRAKLQALKDDLLSNAGETTEHLREDTTIVPDPADRATIEEEHALELRTRDRERKLLKKISQSLARIDAGDYGFCDETGEPIGLGRLLARPTATLSLEAQQRRELKQKMFGD